MKKGQRIRILKTGEIGTIADKELIRQGGKVRKYYQVKLDKDPMVDRWFFEEQLGTVTERCQLRFDGKQSYIEIERNNDQGKFTLTYVPNQDPIQDNSLEATVFQIILSGLKTIARPELVEKTLQDGSIIRKKL